MIYKILESDFNDSLVSSWTNLEIVKNLSEIKKDDPMIMGGDILRSDVRSRLVESQPTIYIHRGYLGNHLYKTRRWWRYSINSFANTRLLDIPYSRWELLNLPKHPWKVKKVKNVLIAPSKMTSSVWDPELGDSWAESMLDKFPKAKVRIRPKARTPGLRWSTLWEDLDWADLVVSQSSAITVEALWYGKKVISLFPCPTWAAGADSSLENWNDPTEPKYRDAWHEHIAWSQFTNTEWASGDALSMIEQYIGNVQEYKSGVRYDFK